MLFEVSQPVLYVAIGAEYQVEALVPGAGLVVATVVGADVVPVDGGLALVEPEVLDGRGDELLPLGIDCLGAAWVVGEVVFVHQLHLLPRDRGL